jgi:saccharopine dehydrogenase-like NADP-dependent oxidoreductase
LNLLYEAKPLHINNALNLKGYPNRDSNAYKHYYGLEDAETFVRGTLRYPGFCEITAAAKEIGLISEDLVPVGTKNWPDLIRWLLTSEVMAAKSNSKLN